MLKSTVVERRVDSNLTSTLTLLCCGVAGWTKGNKLGSEVAVHPAVTGVVLPAAAVNRINNISYIHVYIQSNCSSGEGGIHREIIAQEKTGSFCSLNRQLCLASIHCYGSRVSTLADIQGRSQELEMGGAKLLGGGFGVRLWPPPPPPLATALLMSINTMH